VVDIVESDLFNSVSVYMPLSLAERNIADFDPSWVTKELPALMTCVADNYTDVMKGQLLNQWDAAFRQKSNLSLVVYVIVFLDDDTTAGDWSVDSVSIRFDPLEKAFNKLFNISFIKTMFDEDYDGSPLAVGVDPGSPASAAIVVSNPGSTALAVDAGIYSFNDGVKDWSFVVASAATLAQNEQLAVSAAASTPGVAALQTGALDPSGITGGSGTGLPAGISVTVSSITQGADPSDILAPSTYFDRSLALAYLCKTDPKLSYFWSFVRLRLSNAGFPVDKSVADPNSCWIRSKTAAEEKAFAESGLDVAGNQDVPNPRSQYYWGFLWQMGCLNNTWVVVHSEPLNVLTEALAAWFESKNSSGQYIGNKLSRLRLTGAKIKPFGYPSLLSSDVNENDAESHELLDAKNVGYLKTISDSTAQQCVISSALSLGGLPVTAMMIAAFVNYESAQQVAELTTDQGTLVDPTMTDETAYSRIQLIVARLLGKFSATNGRLSAVSLEFPSFAEAKVGRTAFVALDSWSAVYKDDLTKVTVTGSVTAA
jgi:hypothetical protein